MVKKTETTYQLSRDEVAALIVKALKVKDCAVNFLSNNGQFTGVVVRQAGDTKDITIDADKPVSFDRKDNPPSLVKVA